MIIYVRKHTDIGFCPYVITFLKFRELLVMKKRKRKKKDTRPTRRKHKNKGIKWPNRFFDTLFSSLLVLIHILPFILNFPT